MIRMETPFQDPDKVLAAHSKNGLLVYSILLGWSFISGLITGVVSSAAWQALIAGLGPQMYVNGLILFMTFVAMFILLLIPTMAVKGRFYAISGSRWLGVLMFLLMFIGAISVSRGTFGASQQEIHNSMLELALFFVVFQIVLPAFSFLIGTDQMHGALLKRRLDLIHSLAQVDTEMNDRNYGKARVAATRLLKEYWNRDPIGVAHLLVKMAAIHYVENDRKEAVELLRKSLEICTQLEKDRWLSQAAQGGVATLAKNIKKLEAAFSQSS